MADSNFDVDQMFKDCLDGMYRLDRWQQTSSQRKRAKKCVQALKSNQRNGKRSISPFLAEEIIFLANLYDGIIWNLSDRNCAHRAKKAAQILKEMDALENGGGAELPESMKVWFLRRSIGPSVYHDWLQVGDIHYEISGEGDLRGAPNLITAETSSRLPSETGHQGLDSRMKWPQYLGETYKTHANIEEYNHAWLEQYAQYKLTRADCQTHTRCLASFLNVDCEFLPIRDGWFMLTEGISGVVGISNESRKPITVRTFDGADMVCVNLLCYKKYIIQPGDSKDCWATGGVVAYKAPEIQVRVQDKLVRVSCGHSYCWNGSTLKKIKGKFE